jgi:hypothetical protein
MWSRPEVFKAIHTDGVHCFSIVPQYSSSDIQVKGGFTMKLSDLSEQEFRELVNSMVDDRLCELLGNPDLGLALDEKVREQLKQVLTSPERVTGETVAERLGLHW